MSTKLDAVLELYEMLGAKRRLPRLPPMRRDLLFWMEEPEAQVYSTDSVVVLKEKNPKAEKHYLVLPKEDIPSIRDVKYKHLQLLREMDCVGRYIAETEGGGTTFWFGYHAWQMQLRLHLHVISFDLCGTGMNTVWHWNSFTTPFFLESEDVISHLEKRKFLKVPSIRQCLGWLNGPIICHFCTCIPGDVYIMKDHVKEHYNGTDYFHMIRKKKVGPQQEPIIKIDDIEQDQGKFIPDVRREAELGISQEIKPDVKRSIKPKSNRKSSKKPNEKLSKTQNENSRESAKQRRQDKTSNKRRDLIRNSERLLES